MGLFFQPDESMIDFWRKESFGDLADTLGKPAFEIIHGHWTLALKILIER